MQLVKEKKKETANEQAGRPYHDCKVHAKEVSETVSVCCRLFLGFEVDQSEGYQAEYEHQSSDNLLGNQKDSQRSILMDILGLGCQL